MEPLPAYLQGLLEWLVRTTWQGSVLVVLVLLVQTLAGRRLGGQGRYWLWLVVLIRLALPWTPQSPVSFFNLLPGSPLPMATANVGRAIFGSDEDAADRSAAAGDVASPAGTRSHDGAGAGSIRGTADLSDGVGTATVLLAVWLAGVVVLAGCIVGCSVRLRRVVRRSRRVKDRWVLGLLEECKDLIGTRAAPPLIVTEEVSSPALCGWLRPRLLLPKRILAARDRTELRHIFLHELAHMKRHDVLLGQLASCVHLLHWFNPLIGLGLQRMRASRELACDALALSCLDPEEGSAYGRTIVRQVERALAAGYHPLLAALGGSRHAVRERVALIARFDHRRDRRLPLAMVLVACLACIGLTDGLAGDRIPEEVLALTVQTWDEYARGDFATTHQDEHANIQRASIQNMLTGKYLVVEGEAVTCDADEPGEAGLWEIRFDEVSNAAEDVTYLYSVPARKYLTTDKEGNLALGAEAPEEAARWATWPRPEGVWVISHYREDGYMCLQEDGQIKAWGRDAGSFWDLHPVWRVKTSDDPASNPDWQREKIPGPD